MKMNDRYPTYCANIAELILNLEEARRSVQDWNAPKAGLERKILNNIGLPDGSPPEKGKSKRDGGRK